MRTTTLAASTIAALTVAATPALAAAPPGTPAPGTPGALDASFGNAAPPRSAGVVLGPVGTSFRAVAVQGDGKVVAAGRMGTQVAVMRFGADGTPDAGFGDNGLATFGVSDGGADAAIATGVAILPDGRIGVGGQLRRSGGDGGMFAMRLLPGGGRDTSFGGDGVSSALTGDVNAHAAALVADGAGRLLVGGSERPVGDTGQRATVVRFSTDGSLDGGFGSGGIAMFAGFAPETEAYALALQPDGRVVVGGSFMTGSGLIAALMYRLTTTGGLDPSLNGGSYSGSYARGGAFTRYTSVSIAPDGSIVAAGPTTYLSSSEGFVTRITAAGATVTGFGQNGVARIAAASDNANVARNPYPGVTGVLARAGAVYAASPIEASGGYRLLSLTALRPGDGAPLPGFGAPLGPDYATTVPFQAATGTTYTFINGASTTPYSGPQGHPLALALAPGGTRLVTAGTTGSTLGQVNEPGDARGYVARYVAAPEPPPQPAPQPDPTPQPQPQPQPGTGTPQTPVGGSSTPGTTVVLPSLTRLTLSRRTIDRRHRATLTYTLTGAATIRVTLERATTGLSGRVYRKLHGRRVLRGRAGTNRLTLSRTWDGRTLRRGSYRAVLRNADSSSVRRIAFRVR